MKNEFDEIWARIKSETGLKTLKELALTLKITQQAVSEMKAKGKFPPGWAYLVGEQFNLLTEWIMKNQGPKRLKDVPQNRQFDILNQVEEWLTGEVGKNPKKEIWFEVEFEKAFEEFKKWKEGKEESAAATAYTSTRKVA